MAKKMSFIERPWKKLESNQGAAFLLALLFFLVCGVVSAGVLMAAASNGGSIGKGALSKEEGDYLAVSSALKLVCREMERIKYTYIEDGPSVYEDLSELKDVLSLKDALDTMYNSGVTPSPTPDPIVTPSPTPIPGYSLTLEIKGVDGDAGNLITKVKIDISLQSDGNILVTARSESGYGMEAKLEKTETSPPPGGGTEHILQWKLKEINRA